MCATRGTLVHLISFLRIAMEQTPDKRAGLVTALFDSLADSPELLGDVKDSMVATVLKKLRDNAKELKQENVLRKHENQHTWNAATRLGGAHGATGNHTHAHELGWQL